jgi:autotransporter translocation and assembly factor TamB
VVHLETETVVAKSRRNKSANVRKLFPWFCNKAFGAEMRPAKKATVVMEVEMDVNVKSREDLGVAGRSLAQELSGAMSMKND